MSEPILLALIGGIVTVLTALIGKLSFDVSKTKKAALKTENSINNRPTSMSDRVDEVKESVDGVVEVLKKHSELLSRHTLEVRGLREENFSTQKDIGLIHAQTRGIRRELGELKQADEENRDAHVKAIADRGIQMKKLRAEIPEIVERVIQRRTEEGK